MLRFEAKPGTWIVTDRSGYIVDASDAGAQLFGLPRRDLMFRELLPFFDQPPQRDILDRLTPGSSLLLVVAIHTADGGLTPTIVDITHAEEWERGVFRWQFAVAQT
jgi:PAS domain-containing protein